MAMLTECFFCRKELVVPSADEYVPLEGLEGLEVFEEYREDDFFSLFGEYCCKECYERRILPKIMK